ncbi:uncharacterized protein [Euwallacea fornicatus]|uniref:uncharacterized protein n=1 Tax=Euwallacea fornicatus TaxID=995702 RepID=UPI00338D7D72
MVLLKSNVSDIPENSIILSEADALKYQINIINKWDKSSEIFALKHGPYILGAGALLSGAFFNNYFRRKFLLRHYGSLASYFPICFVPGAASAILHSEAILKKIILMKFDECPMCMEMRAVVVQTSLGVLYPLVLAPIGCAALAVRFSTHDIPYITDRPKEVVNVFKKMFKSLHTKILYMVIAQAFLASVVTYYEASNFINISKKIVEQEEKNQNT